MSYWGNTYMPAVDALVVEAARAYVKRFSGDFKHEWPMCDGTFGTDEQAFRYLVNVIDEAREEFADIGGDMSIDGGYAARIFEALAFGFATLMEGDWCTYDDCEWAVTLEGSAA